MKEFVKAHLKAQGLDPILIPDEFYIALANRECSKQREAANQAWDASTICTCESSYTEVELDQERIERFKETHLKQYDLK